MEQEVIENTNEILIKVPEKIATLLNSNDNCNTIEIEEFEEGESFELSPSLPNNSHQKKTTSNLRKSLYRAETISKMMKESNETNVDQTIAQPVKRKKGRPRKTPLTLPSPTDNQMNSNTERAENSIDSVTTDVVTETMVSMANSENNVDEVTMNLNGEEIFYENIDNVCISVVEIVDDSQTSENSLLKDSQLLGEDECIKDLEKSINSSSNEHKNSEQHLLSESSEILESLKLRKNQFTSSNVGGGGGGGMSSPDILSVRKITRTYQNRRKSKLLDESSSVNIQLDPSIIEQNDLNGENSSECRRSQRKKVMKYDVKDLFKKRHNKKEQLTKMMLADFDAVDYDTENRSNSFESPQTFKGFSSPPISISISAGGKQSSTFDGFPTTSSDLESQRRETGAQTINDKVPDSPSNHETTLMTITTATRTPKKVSEIFKKVKPIKKTTEAGGGGGKRGRKKKCDKNQAAIGNGEESSQPPKLVSESQITILDEFNATQASENHHSDQRRRQLRNCRARTICNEKHIPYELDERNDEDSLESSKILHTLIDSSSSVLEKRKKKTSSPNVYHDGEIYSKVEDASPPILSPKKNITLPTQTIAAAQTVAITPRGRGRPRKIFKVLPEQLSDQDSAHVKVPSSSSSTELTTATTTVPPAVVPKTRKVNEPTPVAVATSKQTAPLEIINLTEEDTNSSDACRLKNQQTRKQRDVVEVADELKDIENFIEKGESLLRESESDRCEKSRESDNSQSEEGKSNKATNDPSDIVSKQSSNNNNNDSSTIVIDDDSSEFETKLGAVNPSADEDTLRLLENRRMSSSLRKRAETDSAISLDASTEFETFSEFSSLSGAKLSDDDEPNSLSMKVRNSKSSKEEEQAGVEKSNQDEEFYNEIRKYVNDEQIEEKSLAKITETQEKKSCSTELHAKGENTNKIENEATKSIEDDDYDDDEEILISFSSDIFSKAFKAGENNFVIEEVKKVRKTKMPTIDKKFNKIQQNKNLNSNIVEKESHKLNATNEKKTKSSSIEKKSLKTVNKIERTSPSSDVSNTNQSEKKIKKRKKDVQEYSGEQSVKNKEIVRLKKLSEHQHSKKDNDKNQKVKLHKSKSKEIEGEELKSAHKDQTKPPSKHKEKEGNRSGGSKPSKSDRDHSSDRREKKDKHKSESLVVTQDKSSKRRHSEVVKARIEERATKENHSAKEESRNVKALSDKVKNYFLEDVVAKDILDISALKKTDAALEKKPIKKESEWGSSNEEEKMTKKAVVRDVEDENELPLKEDDEKVKTEAENTETRKQEKDDANKIEPKLHSVKAEDFEFKNELKTDYKTSETADAVTSEVKENECQSSSTRETFKNSEINSMETEVKTKFEEVKSVAAFSTPNEESSSDNSSSLAPSSASEKTEAERPTPPDGGDPVFQAKSPDVNGEMSTVVGTTTDDDGCKRSSKNDLSDFKSNKKIKNKIKTEKTPKEKQSKIMSKENKSRMLNKADVKLKKQIKRLENAYTVASNQSSDFQHREKDEFHKSLLVNNDTETTKTSSCPFQSKAALKDYSCTQDSAATTSDTSDSSPNSSLKEDGGHSLQKPTMEIIENGPRDVTTVSENSNDCSGLDSKDSVAAFDENSSTGNSHSSSIRRSDRIKTITQTRLQSVGIGLVKDKIRLQQFRDDDKAVDSDEKNYHHQSSADLEAENAKFLKDMEERLSRFNIIKENEYRCERVISKEAKRMTCDCFLTREEEDRGELGCGEDCLNRLLMIECGPKCTVADRCTNRRFQRNQNAPCKVFKTEKKGFGLMADSEILPNQFIMEYVGEVLNTKQFEKRASVYSAGNNEHYYFMALRSDAIIDATQKGNISRFINHSCDPNAETQKWTVNGELRIGFFSTRQILPGEEITFDYQFQRYGREAQKCFCESENCRGWIGEEPDSEEEYEEEEEVSESDEEAEKLLSASKYKDSGEREKDLGTVSAEKLSKDADAFDNRKITTKAAATMKKRRRVRVKKIKTKTDFGLQEAVADPDLEKDIVSLMRTGLKNQAHTLCLSRLMVRAKILDSRIRLLEILRKGEAPCRRLFLDYHGLRLLHGWMIEIDSNDVQSDVEYRHQIVETLETLPISNKTMLKESKVFQIVQSWSEEKISIDSIIETSPRNDSPKDNANSDSNLASGVNVEAAPKPSSPNADDENKNENEDIKAPPLHDEIVKIAKKLIATWENLPEVFRIPKRERIEQMKEHEREADRQYKALNLTTEEDNERLQRKRNKERFGTIRKYKRSRDSPDRKKSRHHHRHHHHHDGIKSGSINSGKGADKSAMYYHFDANLSKEQRRQLFEAKVAKDEADRRLGEERREFEVKCKFYGLDPSKVSPHNLPFCVNPSTGQWYTRDRRPIETPPSHAHIQVPPKLQSTDPKDYKLPHLDLPPLWKFAIDTRGRIYYYHIKIRIPQWEPPIKILPLENDELAVAGTSKSGSNSVLQSVQSTADSAVAGTSTSTAMQEDGGSESETTTESDDSETNSKEKKTELNPTEKRLSRKKERHNLLVQERTISPRREEDRLYNQLELRKYKENKEKIRRRKEEIKRRKAELKKRLEDGGKPSEAQETSTATTKDALALPIQDYLISSDEDDRDYDCVNNPLIDKFVKGDKIVDELDALNKEKPLKRHLPILEKDEHKKRSRTDDKKLSEDVIRSVIYGSSGQKLSSSSSSKKQKESSSTTVPVSPTAAPAAATTTSPTTPTQVPLTPSTSSSSLSAVTPQSSSTASSSSKSSAIKLKSNQSRKTKEKFRIDIAGIIVHHLQPYRKSSCSVGRITNNDDFKHLARKLTHFVMVKELKHCDSTGQTLIVTESVKNKSREFIKKYMAKYGEIYVRPENDPEFKDIPH